MRFEQRIRNLVKEMVELCQQQKKSKKISERVTRGRAHPIANQFEDSFGKLLGEVLAKKFSVLVDYPLSFTVNGSRARTVYPDIAVVADDVLRMIVEVKVDLGYLSEDWSNNQRARFEAIRTCRQVTFTNNIGTAEREPGQTLSVGANLSRAVILLSGGNAHGRLEQFERDHAGHCFVLSRNHSPNDYNVNEDRLTEFLKSMSTDPNNIAAWRRLNRFLKDSLRREQP